MLQDQHASETEQQRLTEQKSILINKFAACEEDNERLRGEIKVCHDCYRPTSLKHVGTYVIS